MTKRYIVATFKDGSQLTRTTTNPDLKWAWRATFIRNNDKKPGEASGFSSTRELAEKAANVGNLKYIHDLTTEIARADEESKPVKAKAGGFRIKRNWGHGAENWKFIKDGKAHLRFTTRDEAEKYIERTKTTYENTAGESASYEIV